jgi:hypothetical protein
VFFAINTGEEVVLRTFAVAMLAAVALAACDEDDATGPDDAATFVIAVENEQFRVRIEDQAAIAEARSLITSGLSKNISGDILRGNGGINSGYSWHLKPASVEFADLTIELCDGMPSYVEENVDYYVDTVKRYCPWGAKVVSEVGTQQ